jgi:hypothetical protein
LIKSLRDKLQGVALTEKLGNVGDKFTIDLTMLAVKPVEASAQRKEQAAK